VDRVARNPPNPRSIKLSVDALAEAADDISGAVPVVTKIATAIANMFGFSVD
jgi:hypothetical protein